MPNNFDSFNFKENPYSSIIGDAIGTSQTMGQPAQQGMPQAMPQEISGGQMPQQTPQQTQQPTGQPQVGGEMMEEESQYIKGQTGDKSQPLMGAIQALNKALAEATDRDEVRTIRGLITIINRLMIQEEEKMMNE